MIWRDGVVRPLERLGGQRSMAGRLTTAILGFVQVSTLVFFFGFCRRERAQRSSDVDSLDGLDWEQDE